MTSAVIRRVYFASNNTPDLGNLLRKALDDSGYGQTISVEELTFQGSFCHVTLSDETLQKIHKVEYLIADPDIVALISQHPDCHLIWAQVTMSGIDIFFGMIKNIKKRPKFILTRHFEGYGQLMAEYVVGQIIFRERKFGDVHDSQKEKKFPCVFKQSGKYRSLDQLDAGILGFGELGQKVAQCCRAMGLTVWAAVRDERYSNQTVPGSEHADHIRPMSRLSEMLESCDYIVNILPSAPGTRGLLSGDVLKPCEKKKSVLINIGRGDVINDESLIIAIKSGWLGGAILDVFNQEPLPPSSELWTLPGVTITPHNSARTKEKSTDSFIHNLKCFMEGKPMKCVVDFNKEY